MSSSDVKNDVPIKEENEIAENSIASDSESEEGWEGVEEEINLSQKTCCLFCCEQLEGCEAVFAHCRSQHMFDVVTFSKRLGLNCISYIKFVNYMRAHKLPSTELGEIAKSNSPWTTDKYMKPFDENDPLLTFDIESYVREEVANRSEDEDDSVSVPRARFEAILQKLAAKEMKLQNAYDRIDRMKDAAKTVLLCNNKHCNSTASSQRENSRTTLTVEEEDNYYFSTYDHFNIHHEMLGDKARTGAYEEAITKNPSAFKNKTVLDVGCGTAILSMFAAKAGASKVIGVDKSDVIFQAMDIVRENGYADVIDLFKGRVEDLPDLEEKVDVIVSEWMGYFLLFEGMLDSVIAARDKFLAPGGKIFPNRCTLSLIATADPTHYKEYVDFWDNVYGFKMTAMKKDVIKEANVESVKPEVACSEPVIVKELDIAVCQAIDTEFVSMFDLVMTRTCEVTAIVGYFDCFFDQDLDHKVLLSTSPSSPLTHWKQTMFLLTKPVSVTQGEVVNCRLSCRKNRRDPRSIIVKMNFGRYHNEYFLS